MADGSQGRQTRSDGGGQLCGRTKAAGMERPTRWSPTGRRPMLEFVTEPTGAEVRAAAADAARQARGVLAALGDPMTS